MTDKQIIKLKSMEDLDEKIIKEKGNTKCIFYLDDECRNGDRTRDCINCARVEYHSLYSLNWDNQARLQKIIKCKEQECEELTSKCSQLEEEFTKTTHVLLKIQYELSDNCNYYRQTLSEIKEIAEDTKDKFYDAIHTGGLYDRLEQIIKKINEVENVENN